GARRRLDPYAGVAPPLAPPSATGHPAPPASPGREGSAPDSAEATMLRPAGSALRPATAAAPLPDAAGAPEQHESVSTIPAWPFVTLAAVLVVVFGVGASLGVRHFLVPEPEPIATSDITAPTAKPDPPGEPTAIEIQIITPGEGTDPG